MNHQYCRHTVAPLVLIACSIVLCSTATPTSPLHPVKENLVEPELSWEEEKSPGLAVVLSIGGTLGAVASGLVLAAGNAEVVGGAIGLVGLVAGPSLGQIYAGASERAWRDIALRSGLLVVTANRLGVGVGRLFSGESEGEAELAGIFFAGTVGLLGYVGLSIWSLVDGVVQCSEYNESLAFNTSWTLQPTFLVARNSAEKTQYVPGLALKADF